MTFIQTASSCICVYYPRTQRPQPLVAFSRVSLYPNGVSLHPLNALNSACYPASRLAPFCNVSTCCRPGIAPTPVALRTEHDTSPDAPSCQYDVTSHTARSAPSFCRLHLHIFPTPTRSPHETHYICAIHENVCDNRIKLFCYTHYCRPTTRNQSSLYRVILALAPRVLTIDTKTFHPSRIGAQTLKPLSALPLFVFRLQSINDCSDPSR